MEGWEWLTLAYVLPDQAYIPSWLPVEASNQQQSESQFSEPGISKSRSGPFGARNQPSDRWPPWGGEAGGRKSNLWLNRQTLLTALSVPPMDLEGVGRTGLTISPISPTPLNCWDFDTPSPERSTCPPIPTLALAAEQCEH